MQEIDVANQSVSLIASFERNKDRESLLQQFRDFGPEWRHEPDTDWITFTQKSWPGRAVGQTIFLATSWCTEITPEGRYRVIHNPGLACGTGEHPCTRLALEALEQTVTAGCRIADVGTGSGLLAIAALCIGAGSAIGLDTDEEALCAARINFRWNDLPADLFAGSTEAIAPNTFDVVVANINASVLLTFADDFLQIVRPGGRLILTGFPESESRLIEQIFPSQTVLKEDGWVCLISTSP